MASPRPPFWPDVLKIGLGVFLGSVLSSLYGALLWWGVWFAVLRPIARPTPPRAAVVSVEDVNDLIRSYLEATAELIPEEEKAGAALLVAEALRSRGDRKGVAEWEDKARRHRDAAAAGKRTGPVR
jgi:hypothetical protein